MPFTGAEKRGSAGLVGTLKWAGKTALETVGLALGVGWDGFGERVVKAGEDPQAALVQAKEGFERHVNAELDTPMIVLPRLDPFRPRRDERCVCTCRIQCLPGFDELDLFHAIGREDRDALPVEPARCHMLFLETTSE